MEAWVVETYLHDRPFWSRLYKAERRVVEELAAIERIDRISEKDIRVRSASDEDVKRLEEAGRVVELSPANRNWLLQTSFDGNSWPDVHRDASLDEMLIHARKAADGICSVMLRPATAGEIAKDDEERAETQLEMEAEALKTLKHRKVGAWVGLLVQVVLTLAIAYCGLNLLNGHEVVGLCLLALASLSTLNIAWALVKFILYQISFVIGRGFKDGRPR